MTLAYEDHDATGLAELVAKGEVSPDALLDCALERTARWNPDLNAVVALDEAAARARIAGGLPDGPLRGVPFLIKDIGCETPDFPASAGSRLMEGTRYARNATVYDRLVGAGLVPFARTTCPEGAIGPVTEAAFYDGPTRNPWSLAHTPGGSSGGAAAAVAAGIIPAAHGSDGGGSIRIPASNCGLFGFKPSRARIPDGPYAGEGWAGMAQDGVLTRSVRDTALLLDILSGPDEGVPYFAPPMEGTHLQAMARHPGRLRVGLVRGTYTGEAIDPDCATAVDAAGALLEAMGHDVSETRIDAPHEAMMKAWTQIVACGAKSVVRKVSARRGVDPDALIEPVLRGACRLAETVSGADYLDAVETIHDYGRAMARALAPFDVVVSSTMAEPPAEIGRFAHARPEFEDFMAYRTGPDGVFAYSPFCAAFNASGQPAMSVPLSLSPKGLPIGIHIGAAMGDDARLMSLAAALEEAQPWFGTRPKGMNG